MSLTILSVATKITPGVQAMVASARLHGLTVRLLGVGQEWRGFGWRLRLVRDALASLPPDSIVLHVDSADVLFTGGEREILDRYEEFGRPFICAGESECWPVPAMAPYFPTGYPYRFLNAGGWMGRSGCIASVLRDPGILPLRDDDDDQAYLQTVQINVASIKTDTTAILFQCLYAAQDHVADGRNILTGTHPVIWHGNGHADMSRVYEWSGLCPRNQ